MRCCSLKKSWTEEGGAATVETAIALFAFLVMMLGAIELASVSWGKVSLNYAISQSARYAYVNSSSITGQSVDSYAATLVPSSSSMTFTFTSNIVPKTSISITGNLQYSFIMLPSVKVNLTSTILQPLPPS